MYNVTIAGVAALTEEVLKVEIGSFTPNDSTARSSQVLAELTITGRVSYDSDKIFMKESTKNIADWSFKKPNDPETYKEVTVEFDHTGTTRKYTFSHAFCVSFTEDFEDQNGHFVLKVRQKADRLDGVEVA